MLCFKPASYENLKFTPPYLQGHEAVLGKDVLA